MHQGGHCRSRCVNRKLSRSPVSSKHSTAATNFRETKVSSREANRVWSPASPNQGVRVRARQPRVVKALTIACQDGPSEDRATGAHAPGFPAGNQPWPRISLGIRPRLLVHSVWRRRRVWPTHQGQTLRVRQSLFRRRPVRHRGQGTSRTSGNCATTGSRGSVAFVEQKPSRTFRHERLAKRVRPLSGAQSQKLKRALDRHDA